MPIVISGHNVIVGVFTTGSIIVEIVTPETSDCDDYLSVGSRCDLPGDYSGLVIRPDRFDCDLHEKIAVIEEENVADPNLAICIPFVDAKLQKPKVGASSSIMNDNWWDVTSLRDVE